jgi:hypothetical protein
MQTRGSTPLPDTLPLFPTPAPLRFLGNRANPNYAAVAHLLRTYARHLGMGMQEAETAAAVEVLWDMGLPAKPDGACLVFPGRPHAEAETACARTRSGYPVPLSGRPLGAHKGGVLEAVDGLSLAWEGAEGWNLHSDWDLLSFCADILFRRADHHPSRRRAAREAISLGQWDRGFGLTEEPWVDRWMFRLLGALPRLRAAVDALPAQARIWLTHDLDNLAKWRPRSVAGQILRTPGQLARGRFAPLTKAWSEIAKRALTGRDPYDVMDLILRMETGRRSANFFLANGRDHLIHRYDLARPRFRRVMLDCLRQGMDVGLHGQVHFISDPDAIRAEKSKMERLAGAPVSLNRQHYLRWDPAATFAGLEAAGIRVDSTLGYNDSPGFRTGTAFPYLWFDCRTGKPTGLLEAPLILGEFQFYQPQSFDPEMVDRTIGKYLDAATRQGGVFTVLFHNNYFHEGDFPGQGAVYSRLLALAGRRGLPDFDPLGTHARYLESDEPG